MTTRRYGQRVLPARPERPVRLGQVARAHDRQPLVAALHLGDDVVEDGRRLLRARDDRRQEVRDRLVEVELDPLRVDQDHPHVLGRRAEQDRRQQRVDAARLAGARRAGDQEVRHPREVRPDGVARDVLAEPDRERARRAGQVVVDVAERHHPRREVRDLDADGLLARDRREDADLRRRERVREVVLEARDLRDLRAGRELQLVADDARARDGAHDRRVHAEVRERLDEHLRRALARIGCVVACRRARLQERPVGEAVRGAGGCVEARGSSPLPSARPRRARVAGAAAARRTSGRPRRRRGTPPRRPRARRDSAPRRARPRRRPAASRTRTSPSTRCPRASAWPPCPPGAPRGRSGEAARRRRRP